jgi:hypothetical protein
MRENSSVIGRPKRQEQIIAQRGADEVLLFNMDDGSYFALNEVGNRIWELCDGTHGMAEMVCVLAKEYNAPAEMIEVDVLEVLEDLRNKDLIVDSKEDCRDVDGSGAAQGSP